MQKGDLVHYTAPHGIKENGIIKSITDSGNAAFVVYNCNNDWNNYQDYIGVNTKVADLILGWYQPQSIY